MRVLAFISPKAPEAREVREALGTCPCELDVQISTKLDDFLLRWEGQDQWQTPVLLLAPASEDLRGLWMHRSSLDRANVLLVLPDEEEETLARGHALHPRVVGRGEAFLEQAPTILQRIA